MRCVETQIRANARPGYLTNQFPDSGHDLAGGEPAHDRGHHHTRVHDGEIEAGRIPSEPDEIVGVGDTSASIRHACRRPHPHPSSVIPSIKAEGQFPTGSVVAFQTVRSTKNS